MALKDGLVSFEFESIEGLKYSPLHDFPFGHRKGSPGTEHVQPVLVQAFKLIKECLINSISSSFNFDTSAMENVNNFMHLAYTMINAMVPHTDGSDGQTGIMVVVKFYRLEPNDTYKVVVDLEEMYSSNLEYDHPSAFRCGVDNKKMEKFAELLDEKFHLGGRIECIPMIKRGRLDQQHFLVSSDDRMMEYDFDKVLFHQRSEFQDVKIVSSPSLGNTLLLDNLQNLAEEDLSYTYGLMDRGKVDYKDKEILILGGGDGGLLWELMSEEPRFVTMAEIDPVVIEACARHLRPCGKILQSLEGAHHKIIIDDCMKVLRQSISSGKKYDVIFNDLTDIPVSKREDSLTAFEPSAHQKDNPWHFIEAIFNLSLDCLADDGLYMNHATGKGNRASIEAYETFLNNSSKAVEFHSRTAYVPSFMEVWVFYTVTKKKKSVSSEKRADGGGAADTSCLDGASRSER